MKYLESYGAVWQLSNRNYKRLLTDAVSGKMWNVTDYGKQVCNQMVNVTDMDMEQARLLLVELNEEVQP